MMRLAVTFSFLLFVATGMAACGGGRPLGPGDGASAGGSGGLGGSGLPPGAETHPGTAGAPTPTDAGSPPMPVPTPVPVPVPVPVPEPPTPVPAPPATPAPVPCAQLESEFSRPGLLDTFVWQRQAPGCQGNSCFEAVIIGPGCLLHFQRDTVIYDTTMGPSDCKAARSWITTGNFLYALLTGADCSSANGKEVFSVSLTDGEMASRQTDGCQQAYVGGVRACVDALVSRYFPR